MSLNDKYTDFISTQLRVEKRPVTVVSMSRNFDISTKEAAKTIELFFQTHKEDPNYSGFNARYSICGKSNAKEHLIQLVDYSKIEETKNQLFSNVSICQLYSVQLANDSALLANVSVVNDEILKPYSKENMIKWGMIFTSSEKVSKPLNLTLSPERVPAARNHTEPVGSKSVTELVETAATKPAAKSEKVEAETTKSRYVSRKASTVPAPAKPKTEYVSRKRNSGIVADSVVSEEENVDLSTTKKTKLMTQKEREALKKQEEKLKDLFEDDEFSDDNTEGNVGEKSEVIDDIDVVETEGENTNVSKPQMDNFFSTKDEESEQPIPVESQEPQEDVPEFETVTDADGFITTKRNVKRPTSTIPTKSKAKSLPDTNPLPQSFKIETRKAAPKKQASLMNFFKKKS